jgi:hypothetical protein
VETVVEDLLEAPGDVQLVGECAGPEAGLAGRAGRNGDHVAGFEPTVAAEFRQGVAQQIVLLGERREFAKVRLGPDALGLDMLLLQKRPIGRNRGGDHMEALQRRLGRVLLRRKALVQRRG